MEEESVHTLTCWTNSKHYYSTCSEITDTLVGGKGVIGFSVCDIFQSV